MGAIVHVQYGNLIAMLCTTNDLHWNDGSTHVYPPKVVTPIGCVRNNHVTMTSAEVLDVTSAQVLDVPELLPRVQIDDLVVGRH